MSAPESETLRLHEDPELFREALRFTAAETGFPTRLIEKDYFCSVLLEYLAGAEPELVFRGGTCLAKIHAGFYRLSEDLDYTIPIEVGAPRAERASRARGLKRAFAHIEDRLAGLGVAEPLRGANQSTQYLATVSYASRLTGQLEAIRVEVALREPLLDPATIGRARTLLLDPVSRVRKIPPVAVRAFTLPEAMAEKLRAALTRREVAIRDFYDIDFAARRLGIDLLEPRLVEMVRAKLKVPSNDPVDLSAGRLAALRQQMESQLRPVLRNVDFEAFDLDRAFGLIRRVADTLEPMSPGVNDE